MSSGRTECGLPAGAPAGDGPSGGGLHLVCRGGTADARRAGIDRLARELSGSYHILIQRGTDLPPLRESITGGPTLQELETGPSGLCWSRPGPRDHFLPRAAWDEAELVLHDGGPGGDPEFLAWFALGTGLPGDGECVTESGEDPGEAVRSWLRDQAPRPALNGLVLAGGHSRRMGRDKSLLEYGGRAQWQRAMTLLGPCCDRVYLSRRGDQDLPPDTDCLVDRFVGFGPIGGLLTALHEHPERAWLVLACDLPLVDADLLANLLAGRRPTALATAFRDPASGLPEPLCTLWEPRSRARIHRFLGEGILCPRKVLVRSTVALLDIPGGRALENVNHPEDYRRVAGKEANP